MSQPPQTKVIAFLSDRINLPGGGPVRVVHTHGAVVFRGGVAVGAAGIAVTPIDGDLHAMQPVPFRSVCVWVPCDAATSPDARARDADLWRSKDDLNMRDPVLRGGGPSRFDAVECGEPRGIWDVVDDLAPVLMDVLHLRRDMMANCGINNYLFFWPAITPTENNRLHQLREGQKRVACRRAHQPTAAYGKAATRRIDPVKREKAHQRRSDGHSMVTHELWFGSIKRAALVSAATPKGVPFIGVCQHTDTAVLENQFGAWRGRISDAPAKGVCPWHTDASALQLWASLNAFGGPERRF